MVNWFSANKLSLNLNKTVAIKFWNGGADFNLKVNGYTLPMVTNTKYLGVYTDNTLTLQVHMNHVIEKNLGRTYWTRTVSKMYTLVISTHIPLMAL